MATPDRKPLGPLIYWEFTLTEQMNTVRYGTFADKHWKQYLPGGNVLEGTHPPKRITQDHYELAKRQQMD